MWQPRGTAPHPVGVDARHFTRVHTAPQRCAAARTRCVFPLTHTNMPKCRLLALPLGKRETSEAILSVPLQQL